MNKDEHVQYKNRGCVLREMREDGCCVAELAGRSFDHPPSLPAV